MYDNQYNNQYHRLNGPSSHHEGVAFWYRPTQEPIYEHDGTMFDDVSGLQTGNMESANVKHRRTRSGCFTCRSRRVKVSKHHYIRVHGLTRCSVMKHNQYAIVSRYIDRYSVLVLTVAGCRKGGRECEFPQPTSSKRSKPDSKSPTSTSSKLKKQESKDSITNQLETIKDEDEPGDADVSATSRRPKLSRVRTTSTQSLARKYRHRHGSEPSPVVTTFKDRSSPQSASSTSSNSHNETPTSSLATTAFSQEFNDRQAKISGLSSTMQRYLQFQREYLTHYHYFFKIDLQDWIHTGLIDEALAYEPLLYAVVGFAAYHYEVRQNNAKLSHFLGYHSKSMSMLRKSLESGSDYTPGMLLTVLQLATFEECLGDWVNLVGHQRAAYSMMNSIYTPESISQDACGRGIFYWFARMDVIASLMGGKHSALDRIWYEESAKYYEAQVDQDPENDVDIDGQLASIVASNRLIGYDMARLYAKVPNNEISTEDFERENGKIQERMLEFRSSIQLLNDSYYTVQDFPAAEQRPLTDEDIVDPYIPGGLFSGALFPLNFMWIDWYAIDMMQRYQSSLVLKQPVPAEMEIHSLEQCRIYEAVARWPHAPPGSIVGAHASIALAAVFLKKDERHIMWMRRKLANVERSGYVFPPHYRAQMARVWGLTDALVGEDDSVEDWWLPNDEGKLPILAEIRKVVGERNRLGEDSGILGKEVEDVRDIRAIFAKLDIRSQAPGGSAESVRSGSFHSLEGLSPSRDSELRRDSSHGSPGIAVQSPASMTSLGDQRGAGSEYSFATARESESASAGYDFLEATQVKDANRMSGIWE